jgi:hypothetical protein
MHDPLVLAVKIADSVDLESSTSRDIKCLQLARWMREEGALSGDAVALFGLACAIDARFSRVAISRWEAALFLLAAGSASRFTTLGIPCPKRIRGWNRREVETFVLSGKARARRRKAA